MKKVIFVVVACVLGVFNASGCVVQNPISSNDVNRTAAPQKSTSDGSLISLSKAKQVAIGVLQRDIEELKKQGEKCCQLQRLEQSLSDAKSIKVLQEIIFKYNETLSNSALGERSFLEDRQERAAILSAPWFPFAVRLEQEFVPVPDYNREGKIMAGLNWEIAGILSPYYNLGFSTEPTGTQEYEVMLCRAIHLLERMNKLKKIGLGLGTSGQVKRLPQGIIQMEKVKRYIELLMLGSLVEKVKNEDSFELTVLDRLTIKFILEEKAKTLPLYENNRLFFRSTNKSIITAVTEKNGSEGTGKFFSAWLVMICNKQVIDTFYMLYTIAQARGKIEDFVRVILSPGGDVSNPETYYLAMVKYLCSLPCPNDVEKVRRYYEEYYDFCFRQREALKY